MLNIRRKLPFFRVNNNKILKIFWYSEIVKSEERLRTLNEWKGMNSRLYAAAFFAVETMASYLRVRGSIIGRVYIRASCNHCTNNTLASHI
jgi:hypothetical protein